MGFLKMIGLVVVVLVLGFWLPFLFRVLPWWCRDIYKYFKYPRKIHLYGIWLYCGLYGQGKTMALTEYLTRMRKNMVIRYTYARIMVFGMKILS